MRLWEFAAAAMLLQQSANCTFDTVSYYVKSYRYPEDGSCRERKVLLDDSGSHSSINNLFSYTMDYSRMVSTDIQSLLILLFA